MNTLVWTASTAYADPGRPGAIAAVYTFGLPRPRSLAVLADPAFIELTQKIRAHFSDPGTEE